MPPRRERYHHGDLRAALIDVAVELLAEQGVHGFSMAEASRRLGVAQAAPYRHFADRDELLAAVAVRAAELLAVRLAEAGSSGTPAQRLAAASGAYVRFTVDERPLFQALFDSGLDKSRYPDVEAAGLRLHAAFLAPALELCGDEERAARLASAVVAAAHGYAVLGLEGAKDGVAMAMAAARALVLGREALTG
ncbi:TetR/AcrR family transcriptional regulator [Nonomuraea sp. NPDC050556]|uniref:TetR/AcrR family transcriptional regulator n=1 Tax=Nonomuraea sp. NPDC050556 TaxID=3364369 RepID=UPI0037B150C6